MAEKGFILSAEEELKLREPIDEYIGKIQEQIDALRLDGTDKVRSLKNHIAVVKESKNLSKEEKTKIIENDKKVLEEANAVESRNKDKVNKFFRLSRRFMRFICKLFRMGSFVLFLPFLFVVFRTHPEIFFECGREMGLCAESGLVGNFGDAQISFEDQFGRFFHFEIPDVIVRSQAG